MDKKIKELLKKYAEVKNSNNGEFSGNFAQSRKLLYSEIISYCAYFDIDCTNDLFPSNMLDLMEFDEED
jgi:hypothetical protein